MTYLCDAQAGVLELAIINGTGYIPWRLSRQELPQDEAECSSRVSTAWNRDNKWNWRVFPFFIKTKK